MHSVFTVVCISVKGMEGQNRGRRRVAAVGDGARAV